MTDKSIETYYPLGELNPYDLDSYGGEYRKEVVTIIGMVSARNQGAHKKDEFSTHRFELEKWKLDGKMQTNKLLVWRPVKHNSDYFKDIPAYSIVELKVFLNLKNNRSILQSGLLISNPSEDLLELKKDIQGSVFIQIDDIGKFELNKKLNLFEGSPLWNTQKIRFAIDVKSEAEITDEIATLKTLLSNQAEWKEKIDQYAVSKLLPLKNDTWLKENESQWSEDTFLKTYSLESILISEKGRFEFWHRDGDIFWGHFILIQGTIKDGPTRADIPG